ncbi:MAG: archaetidylserine decarboxylase [Legionellales bacterium]
MKCDKAMNWKTCLLFIIPQHLFSRFSGWLSRRKARWFKLFSIRWFIRTYKVNVNEAVITDLDAYPTFNAFFIRKLRPETRPIVSDPKSIVSPVDGHVSEFGTIQHGTLIQAKQHEYQLNELVVDTSLAERLQQGSYCTVYLAPQYYHRVHMPMTGQLKRMIYVPGRLFSVNTQSVQHVERLFARNERVVCEFATELGDMVVILVGACQVGNIVTSWHGQVAPNPQRKVQIWDYLDQNILLQKGEELGYFTLGSTVIVLFPPNQMHWHENIQKNQTLRMGEWLGYISPSS